MSTSIKSAEDQAIELIAPRRYHQLFTLPATDGHGPLKVTFSVCGKEGGDEVPTLMFCGGMFGSRWQAPFQNWLAEREGVRIIYIDRPSFGGSTPVPLNQRISVFLEVVPALLSHLNIPHVNIGSHSSGTIFALNLLQAHPDILYPANPSITLCSPWVHQSLSGVTSLSAAAMLPDSLLNHWSSLTGFMINSIAPSFKSSSGMLSSFGSFRSIFQSGSSNHEKEKEEDELRCKEGFGIGVDVKAALDKLVMKYAFAEECSGGNDEARLCLKSTAGTAWGTMDDYPSYIEKLKTVWEAKAGGDGPKLAVRLLLAEEDDMIGDKGRKYLEDHWTKDACGTGIDVECVVIDDTDHDGVLDPSRGAMSEVYSALREKRRAFPAPEHSI